MSDIKHRPLRDLLQKKEPIRPKGNASNNFHNMFDDADLDGFIFKAFHNQGIKVENPYKKFDQSPPIP